MASKKKQTTNSTNTSTATTSPNVPDWLATPYQTAAGNIGRLQTQDPSTYAPTISPDLQKNWDATANLKAPDYSGALDSAHAGATDYSKALGLANNTYSYDDAEKLAGQGADFSDAKGLLGGVDYGLKGVAAADQMGKYRDLFARDVIDPVLADYDVNSGKVRASQAADGARNGAFKGGRFGLREGETEGQLARGRATTYGGLLKDAADYALRAAEGDAGRMQSAQEGNRSARLAGAQTSSNITGAEAADTRSRTGQMIDITGRRASDTRAQAGLLGDLESKRGSDARAQGGLLADIASRQGVDSRATLDMQNKAAAQKNDLLNAIRQYPIEYQKQIMGLLGGLDLSAFTGQTINSSGTGTGTTTSSGSLGALLGDILTAGAAGAGKAAGAAAVGSDRRIKRDILPLGRRSDGLMVYAFCYLWDEIVHIGLMAQEVLKVKPEAVSRHPHGYLMVDYGKV